MLNSMVQRGLVVTLSALGVVLLYFQFAPHGSELLPAKSNQKFFPDNYVLATALGSNILNVRDISRRSADSAEVALMKLDELEAFGDDPTLMAYRMMIRSNIASNRQQHAKVQEIGEQLKELAQRHHLEWLLAESHAELAIEAYLAGELEKAQERIERAISYAGSIQYDHVQVKNYNTAGVIASTQGDLLLAQENFHFGLELAKQNPGHEYQPKLISNMALIYIFLEDWTKALDLIEQGKVFYKQAEHYSSTAEIILYANEAYVHYRLGNKLLARKAYEKGLAVFNSQPHSIRTELVLLRTESDILWLEEKYFPARQSADRCLALAESEALPLETGLCHLSRVRARIALGFHDGVITELLEALRLTEQAKAHSWEMEIHRELASTYELFSNYRQSLAHHKIYYSQNKALLFDRRQSELFLLQESYETNALQQQKALAESEASVAKLKVDKQRLRNWTVIAFTFVVLMSFVQIRRRAKDTLLENKQLAKLHQQDPLTGLGNRRYIDNWLEEDYQPEQGKHYFIALADIDDFKRINDTHGHDVGDSVIVETARRLRKVIGRDEAVVRWGGEEFLLVLKSGNQPQLKLEQIVSEISERPYEMLQDSLAITVSVGASDLCESLTQEHTFELLTKQADRALYCAKSEGKNHAQQYDAARHSSNSDVD